MEMLSNKNLQEYNEILFLNKVLERLKGYACGRHKNLEKMILNRQKKLKREINDVLQKETAEVEG